MGTVRTRYSTACKAQVALEACKGQKTLSELASEFGGHPVQITQWKKQVLAGLPSRFEGAARQRHKADDALLAQLYQEIGQLNVARDWLRKKGQILAARRGP
jgi:transposase-like protein